MWHIIPYIVVHYILFMSAWVLMGLLVVILHLCLLYIGRRYSHFSHHIILSFLVHCVRRFLPRRGLIFISVIHLLGVDYSLIFYLFSFYAISRIWLPNNWYQSSFLGTGFYKTSHCGTFSTNLFLQIIRDGG